MDTRNWKCLIGMHQYSETINSGRYRVGGVCYTAEDGVFYTKKCCHCGKVTNFYCAEKLEDR